MCAVFNPIDYGSVCSGIESVSVAVEPLGWKAAWFAEVEAFPSAVLAHRFPEVANLGDMTKIATEIMAGRVHAPSVLVGGTPCQAFSVAGLRAGLEDARGQLTIKFVEMADAIDHVRSARGDDECVVWWENVPGVLSDKGNAFGCFLAALVGESDALQPSGGKWTNAGCVYGPTRSAAWRILDAQYFGLAQRRRRVFVVASARDGFDPAAVLFERDGMRRDTAPSREAREGVAGGAAASAGERGNGRDIAPTLDATMDRKWGSNQLANNGFAIIEPVIMSSGQANAEIRTDGGAPVLTCLHEAPIVVHGTQDPDIRHDQAHTLGRNSGQENAVLSVALRWREGVATAELGDEVAGCLRASTGGGDKPHVLAPTTFAIQNATRGKDQNGLGVACDAPMYTLDQASQHAVFAIQAGALRTNPNSGPEGVGVQADHAYTLEARAEVQAVAVAFQPGNLSRGAGAAPSSAVFPTLNANHGRGMSDQSPHVAAGSAVRRLTPTECERLQGFPDGWTAIPWRNKPESECPDGPRYKAIGNSKAVPVVRWIAKRISDEVRRG